VVNDIPFIDPQDAATYAERVGSVVETMHRDDQDDEPGTTEVAEEPAEVGTETNQPEAVEEIREQIVAPVEKKNAPRKRSVK
jgi:hypothetical protein